ncbi:glycosyltransferase [Brevibacillus sp. 1238]|uniref:glycosyltransferase family 2 protein n=1 Tax=Brevibacillus sp. 1238 TaxID=2940565 RepID=UPI0024761AF6|nr:glycosyltransferase [Brevibacillus sp. 1238]MDH6350909.1 cellulose synthase/poly-beta-1,6-N-acetylglucosamine synthase-like glycosyltransferase [Brevibacillus sp. 1238]
MAEWLFLLAIISIWVAVFESALIMAGAIRFVSRQSKEELVIPTEMDAFPAVTILVPAHNEELVIAATVEHILRLNYPADKLQVIVIADNCTDQTAQIVRAVHGKPEFSQRNLTVLERTGKGGKSGALNDAFKLATGEWICVYDADAAPEKNALAFLIQKALEQPERYGAVFGRNKARNRDQTLLTQFINLELVTMHRVYHTGLWELFQLGSIPGTNFIVKSSLIAELGGWDEQSLTEDTAISFEILKRGQLIALAPQAEAYQQEPEKLDVYMKQRQRWAMGNYHTVIGNISHLFDSTSWRIKLKVLYYAASYFWFMVAIVVSDIIFVTNLVYKVISWFHPEVVSPFQFSEDIYVYLVVAWALMYSMYVLQINLALATDIGQSTTRNFVLSCLSYFTYAQLFIVISVQAFWGLLADKVTKRKRRWYKTQRFT